jgi:hypothetical protein
MRRRPLNSEISDRPARRDYRHWNDGSPGGDAAINTHIGKGNPGRPKGARNFITRAVKATLTAAERSRHSDGTVTGYLEYLANEHPVAFSRILSRLIPYDLRFRADVRLESAADVKQQLIERGVPIDKLMHLFKRPELPQPRLERRPLTHVQPHDEDNLQIIEQPATEPSEPPYTWSPSNSTPLRVYDFYNNPEQTDDQSRTPPEAAE